MVFYKSSSAAETYAIGRGMGQNATAGQVYCLSGDLGAGKTVFAQGFAEGIGVTEPVDSPTFTILKEYAGRLPLYHFDAYRIEDTEEFLEIGFEEYFYGNGVCLIEWPEQVAELLPGDAGWIQISRIPEGDADERRIAVS